jgi:hypothetical protein
VTEGASELGGGIGGMSPRTAAWLAWSLAGLSVAIFVASVALSVLVRSANVPSSWGDGFGLGDLLVSVPFLAFPVVGALIASRHPRNPIGWICLVAGLFWMLIIFSEDYSVYGIAVPGSVPFPVTINALLYAWLWVPTVGLLGSYLPLLFPDGRLPSRRWRPLAWLSGAVIVSESVAVLFTPGPLEGLGGRATRSGSKQPPGWWSPGGSYSRCCRCACSPRL